MIDWKVVLIIVGGFGMGVVVVKWFVVDGFMVVILLFFGKGEVLVKDLGGIGFIGFNFNLVDLQVFVDQVIDCYGWIDVLVNFVGYGFKGDILEFIDDDWYLGMDYYLMNVICFSRLVVLIMVEQGGGIIINILIFVVFEFDFMFLIFGVFCVGFVSFVKFFLDKFVV